jgi:hypothetical protein
MAHLYGAFVPASLRRPGWGVALLLGLLALVAVGADLRAQGGRDDDNVLYPQPEPPPILAGVEAGYGSWKNKGFFSVNDGKFSCTTFDNGDGKGPTFGAKAMIYVNRWLFFSPRVRMEARSGKFLSPLAGEPARNAANEVVTIEQEAQVDATMSTVSFDGTVGVEFFGLYVFGGGSAGMLLDGSYNYTERMKGGGFTYADTRTSEHQLVTGRRFDHYQKSVFDLRAGAGYLFRIGRFALNPEFFYSSPLTSALGQPDEMRQTGMVGTFGLLYIIR